MKRILAYLALQLAIVSPALGQEFKPYPAAEVSKRQWQKYYDEVQEKIGSTAERIPDANLIVFNNVETHMTIAFTTPDHPAHPAWVTRQVVERDGAVSVNQIGYFAGREDQFAELFQGYRELNDQLQRQFSPQAVAPKE